MDRSKWSMAERLANQIYLLAENALCCDEISEEDTAEAISAAGELYGILLDNSAVDAQRG